MSALSSSSPRFIRKVAAEIGYELEHPEAPCGLRGCDYNDDFGLETCEGFDFEPQDLADCLLTRAEDACEYENCDGEKCGYTLLRKLGVMRKCAL